MFIEVTHTGGVRRAYDSPPAAPIVHFSILEPSHTFQGTAAAGVCYRRATQESNNLLSKDLNTSIWSLYHLAVELPSTRPHFENPRIDHGQSLSAAHRSIWFLKNIYTERLCFSGVKFLLFRQLTLSYAHHTVSGACRYMWQPANKHVIIQIKEWAFMCLPDVVIHNILRRRLWKVISIRESKKVIHDEGLFF